MNCFKRLCISYKDQDKIEDAIRICKEVLALGIKDDGTKKGFEGRLKMLEKRKM